MHVISDVCIFVHFFTNPTHTNQENIPDNQSIKSETPRDSNLLSPTSVFDGMWTETSSFGGFASEPSINLTQSPIIGNPTDLHTEEIPPRDTNAESKYITYSKEPNN